MSRVLHRHDGACPCDACVSRRFGDAPRDLRAEEESHDREEIRPLLEAADLLPDFGEDDIPSLGARQGGEETRERQGLGRDPGPLDEDPENPLFRLFGDLRWRGPWAGTRACLPYTPHMPSSFLFEAVGLVNRRTHGGSEPLPWRPDQVSIYGPGKKPKEPKEFGESVAHDDEFDDDPDELTDEPRGGSPSRPPPLSAEQQRARFQRREQELDDREKARLTRELWARNLGLVLMTVKTFRATHPHAGSHSFHDLLVEGALALWRAVAVDGFDWRKGYTLSTYAVRCIENALTDLMRVGEEPEMVESAEDVRERFRRNPRPTLRCRFCRASLRSASEARALEWFDEHCAPWAAARRLAVEIAPVLGLSVEKVVWRIGAATDESGARLERLRSLGDDLADAIEEQIRKLAEIERGRLVHVADSQLAEAA